MKRSEIVLKNVTGTRLLVKLKILLLQQFSCTKFSKMVIHRTLFRYVNGLRRFIDRIIHK